MNIKLLFWATLVIAVGMAGLAQNASADSVYEDYTFLRLAGPSGGAGALDGQGNAARLNAPAGVARDANGNLYLADSHNNTIRKITPDGQVTTLAGLAGTSGSTDGIGAAARFNGPFGLAVDGSGNVYVSENINNTIRKISPAGVVTTVAGSAGVAGLTNGTGTAALFNSPDGIVVDGGNNLYVADSSNHVVRKITSTGVVTTFAGSGHPGSADKTGTAASFNFPTGLALDNAGNLYVADHDNNLIRKITSSAVVSTLAGVAGKSGSSNGTGTNALFSNPFNVTLDGNGNLYVTDTGNNTVREITPDGTVTTLVGSAGNAGAANGVGAAARFNNPVGIAVDGNTNLYITDFSNHTLRKVAPDLTVTTFAGLPAGSGSDNGAGTAASFNFPSGIAINTNGEAYVADFANHAIREITPDGVVTTLAGVAGAYGTNDGIGNAARFNNPVGVTVDRSGDVLVADSLNHTIRQITPVGSVTTLAGTAGHAGTNDGPALTAQFRQPFGLIVDTNGNIFVADTHNQTIREITSGGNVATFAGTILSSGTNDGTGTAAKFTFPTGLAFDNNDNLCVVDDGNSTIRKITPDASVTTFAGTPGIKGSADDTNSAAGFNAPFGVASDTSGNLFVADTDNNTIRKITPQGVVTTIGGVAGQSGSVDGTGDDARFNAPEGVAVDAQGNVYVADAANHSIRKGYPALPDKPTVDFVGAHVNVTRHFAITNLTTTSWSWRLVRRPSSSTAELSGTNTANPTFTPDVEDAYVVEFQGWDGSGHTTIRRLTLYADDTVPSVTITNPVSNQTLSNGVVTLKGMATDNLGLSDVWVQANGGAWFKANGTANWSLNVDLIPGTNALRAYAEDFAGNISPTNEVDLRYVRSATLAVQINGGGSVTPNLNGALLEIGRTYSMTAQASSGCAFVNWTGSLTTNSPTLTFVMQSNLTFVANFTDPIRPTVVITSPKNGTTVSNANFTATGTAADNGQLAAVWYQLNGEGWIQATNTANWTAGLTLASGANTLQVYAVDTFTNFSTTNSVAFTYVPSSQITVLTNGLGTVTPSYNGWLLQIGKSYTMTAKPTPGYLFTGWKDGAGNILGMSPTLTFVVQSNTTFQVNFVRSPFLALVGPFAGLFYDTNSIALTNSGFFSATVAGLGSFSAKVQLASGASASFSGVFSADGVFSNSVSVKGTAPLIVQLVLDSVNSGRITGTIAQSGWTSPVLAVRAPYSPLNPAPQGSKRYTLVIPGGDDSTVRPAGNGYGTVAVDISGDVSFNGLLGDGTKATQRTFINKQGIWPLYVSSYKGQGMLLGWMTFSNEVSSDLSGTVYWLKLPQLTARLYRAGFGFPEGIQAVGSLYSLTNGTPLLNLPSGGSAILQQGNPVQSFTNKFTLGADNKVASTNGLTITISLASGSFKGTALNPANNTKVPITGVLLQKQNAAYGLFLGTNESGSVYLGP